MYATEVQINPDTIPATDRGFQFGDGVFETILNYKHHPFLLDLHLDRLKLGLKLLDINLMSYVFDDIAQAIYHLCRKKSDGLLKIIVTRGVSSQGYKYQSVACPSVYIFEKDFAFKQTHLTNTSILPFVISSSQYLSKIKHLNRLEQVLATRYIKAQEFDGLLCNEQGDFIEGSANNVFFKMSNAWVTPDLTNCGVDGTLRQYLLRSADKIGIPFTEKVINKTDLMNITAAFFCNSVRGIVPIARIDEHALNAQDNDIISINQYFLNQLLLHDKY